jgi:pyruvate oxidase
LWAYFFIVWEIIFPVDKAESVEEGVVCVNQLFDGNLTVAEYILAQLKEWGIQRIYGVNGDGIFGLLDALAKQEDIQFIAVKHESVAAMMASAEAKLTGNLAVCTATMGPGLGNLLNGLGDAYMDRVPVLVITGQAPTEKIGSDYKQYVNQQDLIKPFASYSTLLAHPNAVGKICDKAYRISMSRGAVSHISVPKDVFTMQTTSTINYPPEMIEGNRIYQEHLTNVIEMMNSAEKPMILAGVGTIRSSGMVSSLAEKWGAGILASLGAKGVFNDQESFYLGGLGQGGNPYAAELFKIADVVLLAGVTWWPEGYVPKNTKIIQIDLSQENIGKGFDPKIGIVGKAEEVIPQLVEQIQVVEREKWVERCKNVKDKWARENEAEGQQSGSPVPPSRIIRAVENTATDNAIISVDTGDVTVWFNRNFRAKNQTILFSGDWRTMGFGLPGALAAKLNYPNNQVIALVGDGGLEMTLADLLTAVRYDLAIKVIVFNNHALQMEVDKMAVENYEPNEVDLTNPNFVGLAESCGWIGYHIFSDENLEVILQEALTIQKPVLINIETAPIIHPET